MLLEHPTETPGTAASCEHCPAVRRLQRALQQLQADFRREVGYVSLAAQTVRSPND